MKKSTTRQWKPGAPVVGQGKTPPVALPTRQPLQDGEARPVAPNPVPDGSCGTGEAPPPQWLLTLSPAEAPRFGKLQRPHPSLEEAAPDPALWHKRRAGWEKPQRPDPGLPQKRGGWQWKPEHMSPCCGSGTGGPLAPRCPLGPGPRDRASPVLGCGWGQK